jgi:hypothetical protein
LADIHFLSSEFCRRRKYNEKVYFAVYQKKAQKALVTVGCFSVICALTFVLAYGASLQADARETLNADIMEEAAALKNEAAVRGRRKFSLRAEL